MDLFAVFQGIIKAGPTVLLPLIIFALAMFFRVPFGKALHSSLVVGAAFIGLKVIIEFMAKNLGPATKAMVAEMGVHLNVIDMGFGTVAAIGWSSPLVPAIVLGIMLLNVVLLVLNKTNTLSVDIWNYHHGLSMGAFVYLDTGNPVLAVSAGLFTALVMLKMSDWASPLISNYYKIEGVTIPALHALMGPLGQPLVIGLILGAGIGLCAGYSGYKSLGLGINMAAAMLLLPKMTGLFVEGLKPISARAKEITGKKLKGRKIFIGLDPAILFGDPAVITTALLMVPILIVMAILLPSNNFLPFADLGALPYKVAMCVAVTNGNIFRSLLLCTTAFVPYFYFGTWTGAMVTAAAQAAGLGDTIPEGMMISSFTGTTMPITYGIYRAFTGNWMVLVPCLVAACVVGWYLIDRKVIPNLKIIKDHNEA